MNTSRRRLILLPAALLLSLLLIVIFSRNDRPIPESTPASQASVPAFPVAPSPSISPAQKPQTFHTTSHFKTQLQQTTKDSHLLDRALEYLEKEALLQGFEKSDFREPFVTDFYQSNHNQVAHIYLRQRINGLEVFNRNTNLNLYPDGTLITMHLQFEKGALSKAQAPNPSLPAEAAIASAAKHLQLSEPKLHPLLNDASGQVFEDKELSGELIPAKLVYVPVDDTLKLAWNFHIKERTSDAWWDLYVDANDGAILEQVNWTCTCSYEVFASPAEDPNDAGRSVVTDPFDLTASPFGWHDTNGISGAEFLITRGNNVNAGVDPTGQSTSANAPSADRIQPDGGASLKFEFPISANTDALDSADASATNLFYWNNICHDVLYHYGFDEAAGNFQETNYTDNGSANDAVFADSIDGADESNASFASPMDGVSPIMSMYPFPVSNTNVVVTVPAAVAGSKLFGTANFGSQLEGQSIFTEVILTDPIDACIPLTNTNLAGKIALIQRGNCNFDDKVRNAEDAGAIAAIIYDNQGTTGITNMSGDDPTITIPSLFFSANDGNALAAELNAGETVSLAINGGIRRDSAYDNTVVVHEYTHGLSSRLTGGPANASCLFTQQSASMSEGWSDFVALVFTAQSSDTATTNRYIGSFALGQTSGFRTRPYTTDFSANELTLGDLTNRFVFIHSVGEIWCSALWDLYWALVERDGFTSDLINGSGGNQTALQLVVDGMKFQPCTPTFIEARDAIFTADTVNNQGANHDVIWAAFAKRGMGPNASSGPDANSDQVVEDFSVPSDTDDLDGDGVIGLLEEAFFMNELVSDVELLPMPAIIASGSDEHLAIIYRRRINGSGTTGIDYTANNLRYTVESSHDLTNWASGNVVEVDISDDGNATTETVTLRSTLTIGDPEQRQFMRVRITRVTLD